MIRCLKIVLLAIGLLPGIQGGAEEIAVLKKNRTIRILSYNIHHGAPEGDTSAVNLDNIAAVIKMKNPDLVALQELDRGTKRFNGDQAKILAEKVGMYYFFSKSIDYKGGDYGVAVLSRYPILESERILMDKPAKKGEQRSLATVVVEVPVLGKIKFASAHLDLVLENRTAQVEQLNALSKASAYPFIVAGDFNTTPETDEVKILKNEYLLSFKDKYDNTYSALQPDRKIDYILLNPKAVKKMKVKDYGTLKNRPESDHLPLFGIYSF